MAACRIGTLNGTSCTLRDRAGNANEGLHYAFFAFFQAPSLPAETESIESPI
jgi:hypothetical protein